jgi:O-antigen ligase
MAHSATALAIFLAISGFFVAARLPFFVSAPNRLVITAITFSALSVILESLFGLKDRVIRLLGREPDLTDRKPLWDTLLDMVVNPWIGAGYENFWSAARLREVSERVGAFLLQAHNGYIDLYLNLGLIGIGLLGLTALRGLLNAKACLNSDYAHAVLALAFILSALAYNYTEAAFKPLHNVFTLMIFALLSLRVPVSSTLSPRPPIGATRSIHPDKSQVS